MEYQLIPAETHSVSLDARKARSSRESTGSLLYKSETYYAIMLQLCKNVIVLDLSCVCCLPEALGVHAHQPYQVCQPHPGRRAGRDIVVSICQAFNIWKSLNIKPVAKSTHITSGFSRGSRWATGSKWTL